MPTPRCSPYVGVTGFTSMGEVNDVLKHMPKAPERLLMCGVLLSNTLLAGGTRDKNGRYPPPEKIAAIFSRDSRCLNLIHYCPRMDADLAKSLVRASEVAGPRGHGLQINAAPSRPWPDPQAIAAYRHRSNPERVVLQIGREAIASTGHDPIDVARHCADYSNVVTDLLLDTSGGLGRPLDPATVAPYLETIADAAPQLGIVIAGGLRADNVAALLEPLARRWPGVSVDAESRLRDQNDQLMTDAAGNYVAETLRTLQNSAT